MFRRLTLLTYFILSYGSVFGQYCTQDSRYTEVDFFDSTEITIGANIQYGIANNHLGTPTNLLMDLYYPNLTIDKSPKRPFIMLFHGGGFSSGDKQSGDIKDLCIHLAQKGFVCASVNYRIGYDFSEYGQYKARYRAIQDGHAAMRYVVNNANLVRIDTAWMFVGGQSAGALLALGMVYADPNELDSISLLYSTTATSVELGNLYTSGNSLSNGYSFKGIFNNWGAVAENEIDREEMLPTLAFHGLLDSTVLIDLDKSFLHYTLLGSRAIHNTLTTHSICTEITIDNKGEHGIFRNAASEFRAGRASCFFKSIFCKTCTNFYSTDSIPSQCSLTSSIKENQLTSRIRIVPNPVEHSFKIEGIDGELTLSLFNTQGQLILEDKTCYGDIELTIPTGLYYLTIRQNGSDKMFTTKLIKN